MQLAFARSDERLERWKCGHCAMPAHQTLVATYAGTTYEFPGALGLAPQWLTRPLDVKGQR